VSIEVGTLLGGRYRLVGRIAAGGMGEVWRGEDTVLGRAVAVKVMHPQLSTDPGFLSRFRNEARHTAALSHPGIATVYDYGEADTSAGSRDADQAYLVMELVDGEPLSDVLAREGRLDPERTMDVVGQTAAALHAAHEAGVVHRDVKPGNLLVRPNGQVVITDFGIARTVDAAAAALTQTGTVLGTAAYISPEQAAGQPATPRSDIYSLGVVAYQCLAGRRPFEGENPLTVAIQHLREPPPPLPASVPAAVSAVVERSMAKEPDDRFPTASEMASAARLAAVSPGDQTLATQVLGTRPMGAAGLGAAGLGAAGLGGAGLGAAGLAGAAGAAGAAGLGANPTGSTQPLRGRATVGPTGPPVPAGHDPYGRDPYEQDPYEQDRYARDPYGRDPYDRDRYAREPRRRSVWPAVLAVAVLLGLLAIGGIVYTLLDTGPTDPGAAASTPPAATTPASVAPTTPSAEPTSASPSPTPEETSESPSEEPSASPSPSPTDEPEEITLRQSDYVGKPYAEVAEALGDLGLEVRRVNSPIGSGEPGTVVRVSPTRGLEKGDTVTVLVRQPDSEGAVPQSGTPTPTAAPGAAR